MITIHQGDCLDILQSMPEKAVNCCVTSPPYYGLRDYGYDGQIGLEETPELYVGKLVQVFREVRRVLRDDGTLWLNLGDSYARTGGWSSNDGLDGCNRGESGRAKTNVQAGRNGQKCPVGIKPKDLIGIPWRVAFALQADGWYLRQDIIWHKPNPMPESVRDRCSKAHEYIFLLSKSARYYYDAEAIKEPAKGWNGSKFHDGKNLINHQNVGKQRKLAGQAEETRNKRSVWTVSTKPFKGAHFATFPPELIEPCILAGCPTGGVVLDPFGGSGTTGEVAQCLGRQAALIELNQEYIPLIENRTRQTAMTL